MSKTGIVKKKIKNQKTEVGFQFMLPLLIDMIVVEI